MWYRLHQGKVVELFTAQPVLHPSLMQSVLELADGGNIGDVWDGEQFTTPALPSKMVGGQREPSQAELLTAGATGLRYLERELDTYVEDEVLGRGYKDRTAVTLYAGGGSRFAPEAGALIDWMTAIYEQAEDLKDDVLAGSSELPTWPELLALLPAPPVRRRPLV